MKKSILLLTWAIMMGLSLVSVQADDTAIYGSGSISVEPNILIVFDTSGSMGTQDVPSAYYDPNITYSGPYTTNKVYRWYYGRYYTFINDVDNISCSAAKDALKTTGYAYKVAVYGSGSYSCGGSRKYLYLGNYRNYEASTGGAMKSRLNVAKEVISDLIRDTEDVRFGLMRFNNNQGGRVIKDIGSVTGNEAFRTELLDAVDGLAANGYTPLAETLAEAGLYFAGKTSWFNSSGSYSDDILTTSNTYTSPMEYRCQKNYIILMTDGAPTKDNDWRLATGTYIKGDTIGDYDNDGNSGDSTSDSSSDYLDDVAKYIQDNDCNPSLGTGDPSYEIQKITTYTIGFQTDQDLLQDTAQNGGGEYYTVKSISGLSEAFKSIISKIKEVNASYVSPVIPVSSMNQTYAGDFLYLGFFMPSDDGRWAGNIKKYGLDSAGDLVGANGNEVLDANGYIKDNVRSYWSQANDGPDVTEGGVGELLLDNVSRTIYTYLGTATDLTHPDNLFSTSNALLTAAELGVNNDASADAVIDDIIGMDSEWKMGDILHSQPVVVAYDTDGDGDTDESYIFAGTNGGMMHAFKDSDGSEVWGFIPREQLASLQFLSDSIDEHEYYVDAPPVLYDDGSDKTLFFGERRGGYYYYAVDITNPEAPKFKYNIGQNILAEADSIIDSDTDPDGDDANLGQSWCSPGVHKIKTGSSSSEIVFLMAGGYDDNQDLETPAVADTEGRAVFAVKAEDGSVTPLNFNGSNLPGMTHCIVDVMGFDSDSDTYTDRVYAGDLNGNIWAFEDRDEDTSDSVTGGDGTWSGRKLFSAGAVDGVQRKIFYSPDAVAETGEDMIFFGTGDRADPEEKGVVNRIYAIRNNWEDSVTFDTLTEDDLVNVTDNLIQLGTDDEKDTAAANLENSRGWFFELENPGEKIISSVVVYDKVLYFTTYEPESEGGVDASDPCGDDGGLGVSRFYAVDYATGGAVADYSDTNETDGEGNTVAYGKKDRSKVIGSSIASSPVVAVFASGTKIYVGIEGGIEAMDPIGNLSMHRFYWQQF